MHNKQHKQIIMTGGAGFVGGVLTRRLLAAGYQVHVIDTLMYGPDSLIELFIHDRFSFTKGDVLDRELLKREMKGGVCCCTFGRLNRLSFV